MQKFFLACLALAFLASPAALADLNPGNGFPITPNATLTPGSLCEKPTAKRYPEGISYCSRAVGGDTKRRVMADYDAKLGFRVTQMERAQFKIDHYIPLCAGGSNQPDNLWPQHQTVYAYTDPLEGPLCEKMAAGRLSQQDAVALIRRAKADPARAAEVLAEIQRK